MKGQRSTQVISIERVKCAICTCSATVSSQCQNLLANLTDRQNSPSSVVAFCVSCRRWSARKYAGSSPNSRRQHKGDVCRKEKPTWWRNPGERTRARSNQALRAPPSGDERDCRDSQFMAPLWSPLIGKLSNFLSLDTHESWERLGQSMCLPFSKFKYGQFNTITKP